MINSNHALKFIFFIVIGGLCTSLYAQTSAKLTLNDVVLDAKKPSIYMCVDRQRNKDKKLADDKELWIRLHNNTIWTIKLNARRMGDSLKAIQLSNGSRVWALTNDSVSYPLYQLEPKKKTDANSYLWGDSNTATWLPSGISAAFSVPSRYFKDNALFLEYRYEWELTGMLGQESNAPVHRVYFHLYDAANISRNFCG